MTIQPSRSLAQIADHRYELCATDYGCWPDALRGYTWDLLTFQPHPVETAASEAASIGTMVDEALKNSDNAGVRVYVYATWPARPDDGQLLHDLWALDTSGNPLGTFTRDHFVDVLKTVRVRDTSAVRNALMIPVGDVFDALEPMILAGMIPGLTDIRQLYHENPGDIHLNNVGSFIASTTWFAVMFAQDPTGLSVPDNLGPSAGWTFTIGEELRNILQTLVWEVVRNHPYAGVAPFQP
jgi:hypothetical protein